MTMAEDPAASPPAGSSLEFKAALLLVLLALLLGASVVYLKGDNIKTTTGRDQQEWERDLALDYVIQDGTFKGLGFAMRSGVLHSEADANQDQTRMTVSYTVALF